MSAEENKVLARRWFEELFNEEKFEVAGEIVAADHALHDPALPDLSTGAPEGTAQIVSLYHGAFSETHITIEDQIAEGEMVVTRWTGRGTHDGELMGVPPSGNRAEVSGISIDRVSGGRIAETWSAHDTLGMMQQIGAIHAPEQTGA